MFSTLGNLITGATKVATAVVTAPVALVVDVVSLPASAADANRGPFDHTAKALDLAVKGTSQMVAGDK